MCAWCHQKHFPWRKVTEWVICWERTKAFALLFVIWGCVRASVCSCIILRHLSVVYNCLSGMFTCRCYPSIQNYFSVKQKRCYRAFFPSYTLRHLMILDSFEQTDKYARLATESCNFYIVVFNVVLLAECRIYGIFHWKTFKHIGYAIK